MKKSKLNIFVAILVWILSIDGKVYADTTCTSTIEEPLYGVNASTETTDSTALGANNPDDSYVTNDSSYLTFEWTMDDGTVLKFDGYTNADSLSTADKYGDGTATDVSRILGKNDALEWSKVNGNWKVSSINLGENFDSYMSDENLFTTDKKTATNEGLYLAQLIASKMGVTITTNEEAAEFLSKGQLDVTPNTIVVIKGEKEIMNGDNMDDICSRTTNLEPLCNTMKGTVVQTDGSSIIGTSGYLSAKPNSKNREVKECIDCPDNPDFPKSPNLPQRPENECPQYTCQELYGKVCDGAKSRDCSDTEVNGGRCSGFSYSQSSDVQYCSNRVGQEVSGTNGLSHYYCYEYGNVSAPSVPSSVFANRGFNLYGSFSANETRVCVKDNGANIYAEHAKRMTLYENAKKMAECKKDEITGLEEYIISLNDTINSASDAWSEANNIDCSTATDKNKCEEDKEYSKKSASSTQSKAEEDKEEAEHDLEQAKQALPGLEEIAKKYLELTKETKKYIENYEKAEDNIVTNSNSISVSNPVARIGNYSILAGQVTSINKNNASFEKIEKAQNSMPINYQFFVPNVANNTNGNVSASVSGIGIGIDLSYDWSCPFNTQNFVYCTNDCSSGNFKLIFRPISLKNPFPGNRNLGKNWTEEMSEKLIKNNRDVSAYEVYNLEPMYTIVLTPSDIKKIRNYNKKNSYNSFDEMKCENGIKCRNTILNDSNLFSTPITGCGMSDDWNACFSNSLADYKESITTGINQKKDKIELFKEGVNV